MFREAENSICKMHLCAVNTSLNCDSTYLIEGMLVLKEVQGCW